MRTPASWLGFAALAWAFAVSASAQSYSINWSTIDGGGGTSTGGVYMVSGTIGQPDAGTMSGATYTLSGGFWSIAAVQTPGAPYLWATLTSTNSALIWWTLSPTRWRLQATTELLSTGNLWTDCSYQTNGATCYRLESPPSGRRFYRLQWP